MLQELDQHRWRVYTLAAIIAALALLVFGRLIYLQVIQHDYYTALAQEEHWLKEEIPPERGTIFDTNGYDLARSVTYEALWADTNNVKDADKLAQQLAPVLNEPEGQLRDKLAYKQPAPVLIKDRIPYEMGQHLRELKASGVYLLPRPHRSYPEGSLASQTLGLVGKDNQGLSGIEAYLDSRLAGTPGVILAEKDTDGQAIALTISEYKLPERGNDVVLTIDRFIQRAVERELEEALARSGAKSGSVVVLDPKTGAVLAIANRPSFQFGDPDLFTEQKVPLYKNAAVSDGYEPGSIFKIITMAAGLDSGAISPDEAYLNTGSFEYGGGTVHNAISRPQGMETMTQILVRSSNIGAAYIASKTGAEAFYRYVHAFGFGEITGIEIGGESAGQVHTPNSPAWQDFDLATNSFGQGIAVTPLQMAAATAAIANGGTLMRPRLVQSITDKDGTHENPPAIARQVINPSTAKEVTAMLVETVASTEGGVERESYLPGYRLAGKTGTAEIPDAQGYRKDATITSFAGYGPADDPRFVIVVKIVEPQSSEWAEAVAAPVFRNIAQQIVNYYGIPPSN